ncbi:LAAT1 protein, partial [Atractosteus spatula]|nr:LAAT1 protein [Atractosteus spatula]
MPSGREQDGNFSQWCPNGSQWVWEGLQECAQDARDMASVALGLLSILCFMTSSIPQYISSCRRGNMDQALSVWFLVFWLAGDTCNLTGSFLANQLPLQTYTAVYYVLADLLMIGMFTFYKFKNKRHSNAAVLYAVGVASLAGVSTSLTLLPGAGPSVDAPLGVRGRVLLSVPSGDSGIEPFETKEIIGFVIGSMSSVLYLCSRLPQIYTNFKRKSTEGVSYFLFALVILGNMTYGLSVLLKNPDHGHRELSYIVHHLPWLIGSLGTLSLDIVVSFTSGSPPWSWGAPVQLVS